MGKEKLPILKHPTIFKIIIGLYPSSNSCYGLNKIIGISHPSILSHLRRMEEENFVKKVKKSSYELNNAKLLLAFRDYCLEHLDKKNAKKVPAVKVFLDSYLFKDLMDLSFKRIFYALDVVKKETLEGFFEYLVSQIISIGSNLFELDKQPNRMRKEDKVEDILSNRDIHNFFYKIYSSCLIFYKPSAFDYLKQEITYKEFSEMEADKLDFI